MAWNWIQNEASQLWAWAQTDEAYRWYALIAGLLSVIGSLVFAYFQYAFLSRNLNDPSKWLEDRVRESGVRRGPHSTPAQLESKKTRIRGVVGREWLKISGRLTLLVVFGFVLPFALLTVGVRCYNIFDPGHAPLVDVQTKHVIVDPPLITSAVFVLDQFSRGAVSDYMEVYKVGELGGVEANPAASLIRPLCLLFRTFVGIFSGFVPFFVVIAIVAWFKSQRDRAYLNISDPDEATAD
jgi:hypothetical protein